MAIILSPLKYLIKKKNIVILSGPDSFQYCDNCRYLYEYLSENNAFKVYWFTNSETVKKYLDDNNLLYISSSNPIMLIYILLKSKFILNSGDAYLNTFNLSDNPFTYKICLNHGAGPMQTLGNSYYYHGDNKNIGKEKAAVDREREINLERYRMNKFNYSIFTSKYTNEKIGSGQYKLPKEKILALGYPRNDHLYNKKEASKAITKKDYCRFIIDNQIKSTDKVVLYTPTWRSYVYNLPILDMPAFDITEFNDWLEENNIYFIVTYHSIRKPQGLTNKYNRIKMIVKEDNPLFDINKLMLETDILLNDYSSTSIDFGILKRPQLFFLSDYDRYSKTYNFIEDYKRLMPGKEIYNYDEFIESLKNIIMNPENYFNKYKEINKELLDKYYDVGHTKSSRQIEDLLMSKIK